MEEHTKLIKEACKNLADGVPVTALDGRLVYRCLMVLLQASDDLAAVATYLEAVAFEAQKLQDDS